MLPLFAALTIAALAHPLPVAQAQSTRPLQGEWGLERETTERWLHGRQIPRFSPFRTSREWLVLDSVRNDPVSQRIHVTLRRAAAERDSGLIVADGRGRVSRYQAGLAPYPNRPSVSPDDSLRWAERQRIVSDGFVSVPEARLWDIVLTFPVTAPARGRRWTDTLVLLATNGFSQQSLRGIRVSRIVRDTFVDGRRLWVVEDSARVQYREHYLERERTLDTVVQVSRTADGIIRGRHLYDPQLRLFRTRHDTTRLSGQAVLLYPDGRSFRTPARYERGRQSTLQNAAQYAARRAELDEASRRDRGGMVISPRDDLQRRLAAGDSAPRDSLVRLWRRTTDLDEGGRIFGLLARWAVRDDRTQTWLDSMRVAAGDTAHLYRVLARRAYSTGAPPDTSDVLAMLPFMEDPAIAWGLNMSRDWLYENFVQGLTTWPRAGFPARDGDRLGCTIAACRLMGEQWRAAREPRLRDVGLVALFSVDPARYADTVLALSGPDHPLLESAVLLARGVGATWPAASKAPMPERGSDWRVWLEWMDGRDPRYAAAQAAYEAQTARAMGGSASRARFDESHEAAIRFFMTRSGRDIIGELQLGYANAASDSARLIFGSMLQKLGALQLTNAEIAEALMSTDRARFTLGSSMLLSEFQRMATPLSADSAAPFLDRLIAATVDSGAFWRPAEASPVAERGRPQSLHARPGRLLIDGTGLPDALRAKWASRFEIISPTEWKDRNPREAGVLYTFTPVRRWGRFIQVQVFVSERLARPEGSAPAEYAAWNAYYLMEVDGEWVAVARQGGIT